ncbi:MAG: hypothetical protein AAF586_09495 [Planctomycetota bacterium]
MARSLGELFPVIVAVLGVYFLLGAMFSSTVVTSNYKDASTLRAMQVNEDALSEPEKKVLQAITTQPVPVGPNPAPGLYAIASALCFGSVLLWSRMGPAAAPPSPEQD